MPLPRIVATDLDGTLLRRDLTVSDFTRNVLQDLEQRGVQVVFVTARPPRWMTPLAHIAPAHGRAICLNGACVWDFGAQQATQVRGFTYDAVAGIVRDLRKRLPAVTFAAERVSGAVREADFAVPTALEHGILIASVETMRDEPTGKLLARSPGMEDDEFFAHVSEVVADRALLAYSGAHGLAEMTAPGVTKAAALERWATSHGVSAHEVVAFGDMPNDIPMLRWAGLGVAVANAHQDAQAHADAHTTSNDDDGVARFLADLYNLPTRG